MVKVDIIRTLELKVQIPFGESEKLINTLIDLVKDKLMSGESVMISGFGRFELKDKAPRSGRNPKTKEIHQIDARRVVTFHPSRVWKEQLISSN
ncbi:MAG: HU family DNA-binding protein [SAR324 cluster bacterium]|nr:HU family DNA-binding protein [SAR324 cluster bacterium]